MALKEEKEGRKEGRKVEEQGREGAIAEVVVVVVIVVVHPLGMLRKAEIRARAWNFLRISVINPTSQAQIAVK